MNATHQLAAASSKLKLQNTTVCFENDYGIRCRKTYSFARNYTCPISYKPCFFLPFSHILLRDCRSYIIEI